MPGAATALALQPGASPGSWQAALPPGAAGQWCRLAVGAAGQDRWWTKLEVTDLARGQVVREAFLGRRRLRGGRWWRATLVHLPFASEAVVLTMFAEGAPSALAPVASVRVFGRAAAWLALLLHGWRLVPGAWRGGRMGLAGRLRAVLGQAPARAGEAPGYDVWCRLYDRWSTAEREALRGQAAGLEVVIVGAGAAAERTRASLATQWLQPSCVRTLQSPAAWQPGAAAWVLPMQAGETMPDHALACFAHATVSTPEAGGFYADLDHAGPQGRRDPLFKPGGGPVLVRSGLVAQGACLFRAGHLRPFAAGCTDAAAWRQSAACALPDGAFQAIPFVLTHVPASVPTHVPASVLTHGPASVLAHGPAIARPAPHPASRPVPARAASPMVSIVIPTAARSAHVLRCLRRLVARTRYEGETEILLAVSQVVAGDRVQAANLANAARLPGVRVLDLGLSGFNYAAVNNRAVGQARGELVLLANDDVVPLRPDWLGRLAAFLDRSAGAWADIVGPRLLYAGGRVQHGGVIMGLANLCEHAFRLAGRHDPGPHGLALVDREVSAVTAACMLLRRSVYDTVGGMDERFAIALNDVDLCLRAGRAGARIVFAASVELHHYESLSLGRHYAGPRAGLEAAEVRRLRDRWSPVIAADPFYNLSASLEPGREFLPGFPRRLAPLHWLGGDARAPDLKVWHPQLHAEGKAAIPIAKG